MPIRIRVEADSVGFFFCTYGMDFIGGVVPFIDAVGIQCKGINAVNFQRELPHIRSGINHVGDK